MIRNIQYRVIGTCPKCGKIISRSPECSHATCNCSNPPNLIELSPAIILSGETLRKFQRVEDRAKVALKIKGILEARGR